MKNIAERLLVLFAGLDRAHGVFRITGEDPETKKKKGKAQTDITGGPTIELWEAHLNGEIGLGVVPITDDATCYWACIDIDVNDVDHNDLEKKVKEFGMPLVVFKSKSGGAHLILFLSEPTSAELVRLRMMEWSALLGFPGVEVFPKQTRLSSKKGDVGNWLNMPYFGGERVAVHDGIELSVEEMIDFAESKAVSVDELTEFTPVGLEQAWFHDGPPCLETLHRMGEISEGSRNEALFSVAVYLKQRDVDGFTDSLADYNETYVNPPLPPGEVSVISRSVRGNDYFYKCKSPMLAAVCNRELCRTRQYGLSATGSQIPAIDHLEKVTGDPPFWRVNVNGQRVHLDNVDELNYFRLFKKAVMTQTSMFIPDIPNGEWQEHLQELYKNLVEVDAPEDSGIRGQFIYLLDEFLTTRATGTRQEDLLNGVAYVDGEREIVFFRAMDLFEFVKQKRFREYTLVQMYENLREAGVTKEVFFPLGKTTRVWGLPWAVKKEQEVAPPPREEQEF